MHTTVFQVPEHTRINVTIYQYDSGSPLRNQQLGQVTGTYGNIATLNGRPFRVINSNVGNGVGHTFTIPSLGISVPLYGNNGNANLCGAAPCTLEIPAQHHPVLVQQPGTGQLPVAVLRPLRSGLALRQRGTDVDARLHGRVHEGGCVSATDAPGPEAPAATTDRAAQEPTGRRTTGGVSSPSGSCCPPFSTRSIGTWPVRTSLRAP